MKLLPALLLVSLLSIQSTMAADHRVEPLDEGPPSDALSKEIVGQLSNKGIRVIRGSKTTLCDIWLCAEIATKPDFTATAEIIYPFQPGQLMGAVRFARKSADFRDQDIESDVYTLRYAHQPVDGAHVGTSLTRDFLLLLPAKDDTKPAVMAYESLTQHSAEAAQTNHPCMLSMQRCEDGVESPRLRHDEEHDWWILGLKSPSKSKAVPFEFVIVGQGEE